MRREEGKKERGEVEGPRKVNNKEKKTVRDERQEKGRMKNSEKIGRKGEREEVEGPRKNEKKKRTVRHEREEDEG